MSSALDAGDYKTARLYASFCELNLPNNLDPNNDIGLQFYAIQMVFNHSYIIIINIIIIIIIRFYVLSVMIV